MGFFLSVNAAKRTPADEPARDRQGWRDLVFKSAAPLAFAGMVWSASAGLAQNQTNQTAPSQAVPMPAATAPPGGPSLQTNSIPGLQPTSQNPTNPQLRNPQENTPTPSRPIPPVI